VTDPGDSGPSRRLIVNADDFGQSSVINRGVVQAHRKGIVTSASAMVRWPAAPEAARHARDNRGLSVGLHVDLGEWAYRGGRWDPVHVVTDPSDPRGVGAELARQLDRFHRLFRHAPTHLDSHQHVHRDEPLRSLLLEAARDLGVPVRHFTPGVRYEGSFYGQTGRGEPLPEAISLPALLRILAALPPGVTELGCHPALGDHVASVYRAERNAEVAVLCDPRLRQAMAAAGIELRSFRDVPVATEQPAG